MGTEKRTKNTLAKGVFPPTDWVSDEREKDPETGYPEVTELKKLATPLAHNS